MKNVEFERILRPMITDYLGQLATFAGMDEETRWQRWLTGLSVGKRGAERILAMVTIETLLDVDPFADL